MKKKLNKILFVLICCTLIAGCTETKILERISIITIVGYDIEDPKEDKITATYKYRQVSPDNKSTIETLSNTEETGRGTRMISDLQTSKKMLSGQLRVVLFGQKFAEAGLEHPLQSIMMNPEFSSSMYLAVTKEDSKSLIEAKYENIKDIGGHIFNLIDHNVEQQRSVSSTLHEIVRNNYSKFRDIAMPIVKKEGDILELDGIALFNKDKMVGELSAEDTFYVIMLRDKFKAGALQLTLPNNTLDPSKNTDEQLQVVIDSIKSKRTINLVDKSTPEFDIEVDFGCRIIELHSTENVGDPKVTKKLEKAIGKKMEEEITRVIKHTQEKNSDVFGFGDDYHASVRNSGLTEEKWYKMYPNMKVNVKVNIEIIRNGVFE